ncbi:aspartate/glutamate racemase family protein [Undibacterium sp. TS12]|nr:aspartate/glutamate racemase family protein [Undibacterium sp. TS12]
MLQHIRQILPHESLLYVADAGYTPYGDKPASLILERSIAVTELLLSQGIKALVVACNTATASAIKHLRERYPELIIIGMEPGLKPATQISKTGKVGVLATRSTLQSEKYLQLSTQLSAETGIQFIPQACVGLVDQIEKLDPSSAIHIRQLLDEYIPPLLETNVDTLVLGCTHYPFVADFITEITEKHKGNLPAIQLIDTGRAVALHLKGLLMKHALASEMKTAPPLIAYSSGSVKRLQDACRHYLNLTDDQFTIASTTGLV